MVGNLYQGHFHEVRLELERDDQLLAVLAVFSIVFPMWFFRYARALWIAFDERWDPWPNDQERRQIERERAPLLAAGDDSTKPCDWEFCWAEFK